MGKMNRLKKWDSNKALLNAAIRWSYAYGIIGVIVAVLTSTLFKGMGQASDSLYGISLNMVESALFAALVGNLAVKASQVDPKEAPLEERISTLFNNANISNGAKAHLKKYVGDFATYSPLYELNLEYTEFDSTKNCHKLIISTKRILVNSLKDDLTQATLPFDIFNDKLENHSGPRALIINNIVESRTQNEDFVQHPIEIYEDHYSEKRTYSLQAEEELIIKQKYSIYHAMDESYYVMPQKYTDMLKIRVINKTRYELKIFSLLENIPIAIAHGHETVFTLNEQGPDSVEIFRTMKN